MIFIYSLHRRYAYYSTVCTGPHHFTFVTILGKLISSMHFSQFIRTGDENAAMQSNARVAEKSRQFVHIDGPVAVSVDSGEHFIEI